jgi:hypothetical protein
VLRVLSRIFLTFHLAFHLCFFSAAIGFSIYGGSGTTPRAEETGFALWNLQTDSPIWLGDFGRSIVGVMDIEAAGEGLAYAIIHPCPAEVLEAQLVLLDSGAKRYAALPDSIPSSAGHWR